MQNFDNQVGKLYMQIPSLRYANFSQKMAQNTRPPSCITLHLIAILESYGKLRYQSITLTFVSQCKVRIISLLSSQY